MNRRVLFASLLLTGAILLGYGCVGDDPEASAPQVVDASSSSGQVGDGASDADGTTTYGVFLTSTRYPTSFAEAAARSDGGADIPGFVESQCSAAAAAVGLPNAASYYPVVTLYPAGSTTAEFTRFFVLASRATGRWCGIVGPTPHVDCLGGLNVIFDNPQDVARGPRNTVAFDEHGVTIPDDGRFYSGEFLAPGATSVLQGGRTSNCSQWTLPYADGGVPDAGEAFRTVGFGSVVPNASNLDYGWLIAGNREACSNEVKSRLLCVEVAAAP